MQKNTINKNENENCNGYMFILHLYTFLVILLLLILCGLVFYFAITDDQRYPTQYFISTDRGMESDLIV